MGREIKRVALDFDWPLHKVWKGFLNPYSSTTCTKCDGTGVNAATKQLMDAWYGENFENGWQYDLTQDEVDALVNRNRLHDFTHNWIQRQGWVKKDPMPQITPEEVNVWARKGLGHDCINQWICVETRAKRLGIYGECLCCEGTGEIWYSKEVEEQHQAWEGYGPPEGEGWQLWETVSEGSPVSPVFERKEDFVRWLAEDQGYSAEAATRFVEGPGWVPSMIMVNGQVFKNIESVMVINEGGEL